MTESAPTRSALHAACRDFEDARTMPGKLRAGAHLVVLVGRHLRSQGTRPRRDELLAAVDAARQAVDAALTGNGDLTAAARWLAAAAGELDDLMEEIQAATRNLLANWETGDLAGAVNDLRLTVFDEGRS